jgi:hypothetical protein
MIIQGNARCDTAFWAKHLMRVDHNESVSISEIRGLAAQSVKGCLEELQAIAEGTRTKNGFYVASLNPREDELLTAEEWEKAADIFERKMGLEGQPRFIVEHVKEGRTHRHGVWGRIDAESMKAIPADFNYQKHEQAARAIEQELGLVPVESVLVADRTTERPDRRPQDYETFRALESKIDPQTVREELTALWQAADSGLAFKAALEDSGYILARGDRRDFVVIDAAGDDHSLGRRTGAKAADVRSRMADVDRDLLPSVAEARQIARSRADSATGGQMEPATEPAPQAEFVAERQAEDFEPLAATSPAQYEELRERRAADLDDERPRRAHGDQAVHADDAAERVTPWGRAWLAFTQRITEHGRFLSQFLSDELTGDEASERGWAARVFDAARHTISGWTHRDGQGFLEGVKEAFELAREKASEIHENHFAAGGEGQSWADRIRSPVDLIHDISGCGPGVGRSNPQSELDRMAEAWAAMSQDEPQAATDPSCDATPLSVGRDGPDIE